MVNRTPLTATEAITAIANIPIKNCVTGSLNQAMAVVQSIRASEMPWSEEHPGAMRKLLPLANETTLPCADMPEISETKSASADSSGPAPRARNIRPQNRKVDSDRNTAAERRACDPRGPVISPHSETAESAPALSGGTGIKAMSTAPVAMTRSATVAEVSCAGSPMRSKAIATAAASASQTMALISNRLSEATSQPCV